jgi:hypothetical protein
MVLIVKFAVNIYNQILNKITSQYCSGGGGGGGGSGSSSSSSRNVILT